MVGHASAVLYCPVTSRPSSLQELDATLMEIQSPGKSISPNNLYKLKLLTVRQCIYTTSNLGLHTQYSTHDTKSFSIARHLFCLSDRENHCEGPLIAGGGAA